MTLKEEVLKFSASDARNIAFKKHTPFSDQPVLGELVKIIGICKSEAEKGKFGALVRITCNSMQLILQLRMRGFDVESKFINGDTWLCINW